MSNLRIIRRDRERWIMDLCVCIVCRVASDFRRLHFVWSGSHSHTVHAAAVSRVAVAVPVDAWSDPTHREARESGT
eukprot:6381581-Prymnesium_polylepis.1